MKYGKVINDITYSPSNDYSEVEEVRGYINSYYGIKEGAFPQLKTCAGYICSSGGTIAKTIKS